MHIRDLVVEDSAKATESVSIAVYKSAGFVLKARMLALVATQAGKQEEQACLATANILMAAAGMEAVLAEAASIQQPRLYANREFRKAGVPDKFKKLRKKKLATVLPEAVNLWNTRNALTHSEPDNNRSQFVGEKSNVQGAHWAVETLEKLCILVWDVDMPKWFQESSNIKPQPCYKTIT